MIKERNQKRKKNWAMQLQHHQELEKESKVDMRAAPPLPVSTVPMSTITPFEQIIVKCRGMVSTICQRRGLHSHLGRNEYEEHEQLKRRLSRYRTCIYVLQTEDAR